MVLKCKYLLEHHLDKEEVEKFAMEKIKSLDLSAKEISIQNI